MTEARYLEEVAGIERIAKEETIEAEATPVEN
jgi:hypothetical protein